MSFLASPFLSRRVSHSVSVNNLSVSGSRRNILQGTDFFYAKLISFYYLESSIPSNDLKKYYNDIKFRGKKGPKNIKATNTLISKILLGTLGCTPALDRYFIDGARKHHLQISTLNRSSLNRLFEFLHDNRPIIIKLQRILSKKRSYYPVMKLLDMYFREIGLAKT